MLGHRKIDRHDVTAPMPKTTRLTFFASRLRMRVSGLRTIWLLAIKSNVDGHFDNNIREHEIFIV